jgi:hypothetical protein
MRYAALVLLVIACRAEPDEPEPESPLAEFTRIGEALYAGSNPVIGSEKRRLLEKRLAEPSLEGEMRVQTMVVLATEELQAGDVERAIDTLQRALALGEEHALSDEVLLPIHRQLGLSWLRLAENQNCIERHNRECCIFPLTGGAIHAVREPAAAARDEYEHVLSRSSDDLESQWLLNIAAMALGEPAESVHEAWRLPARAFAAEAEVPRWRDVAAEAGVDAFNLAGGVAVEDFDGDGLFDVLTSTCDPLGPLLYFVNRGDGTFADRSAEAGTTEQLGGLNLVAGDVDNDGDQDALVLRGAWLQDDGKIRKSLLLNDGERFRDVTREAGLAASAYPTQAATFGDFDDDGWLDVYVLGESGVDGGDLDSDYPSELFRNRGDGTFVERAAEAGVRNDRYGKGAAAGDYDDDGDLDLFVSNVGKKRLYRNAGDGTFADVAGEAGVVGPEGRTFACWFFDQDEDGRLDLWLGGYQTTVDDLAAAALRRAYECILPALYHNRGDGTFVDRARELGLARPMLPMGANFGDIDGDGWLDIYLGTGEPSLKSLMPNVLLRSDGGRRYLDVTEAAGLGQLQKGHGIGFADFDGDGDQDIYHQLGGFFPVDKYRNALYENPGGSGNHWLHLSLVGTKTNRDAVGARVELVLETAEGERTVHRAAGSVSSFGGSPHRLEIGLGQATRVARLEVRWPRSRTTQVFEDVPMDAWVRVTEGEDELERVELRRFTFGDGGE